MALISCSWCRHDVIQPDNHARWKPYETDAPRRCVGCRFCDADREKADVAK